ncbi:MAG: hypothetical protein U1F65_02660 [Verrucomicrobiota bacterium]
MIIPTLSKVNFKNEPVTTVTFVTIEAGGCHGRHRLSRRNRQGEGRANQRQSAGIWTVVTVGAIVTGEMVKVDFAHI